MAKKTFISVGECMAELQLAQPKLYSLGFGGDTGCSSADHGTEKKSESTLTGFGKAIFYAPLKRNSAPIRGVNRPGLSGVLRVS